MHRPQPGILSQSLIDAKGLGACASNPNYGPILASAAVLIGIHSLMAYQWSISGRPNARSVLVLIRSRSEAVQRSRLGVLRPHTHARTLHLDALLQSPQALWSLSENHRRGDPPSTAVAQTNNTASMVISMIMVGAGGAFSVVGSRVASQAAGPHQDVAVAISHACWY